MVRDNPHVWLLMMLGTPEMFFLSSTFSLSDHIHFTVIFIGQCDTHLHNFCTKNIKNLQSWHKYRLATSWSLLDLPHLKCVVYFFIYMDTVTHNTSLVFSFFLWLQEVATGAAPISLQVSLSCRASHLLILPLATRSCNWCSPDIFASEPVMQGFIFGSLCNAFD